MSGTLLYITANPKSELESSSLCVGRKFIESYQQQNPDHIIEELDLYKQEIPFLDAEILNGLEEMKSGRAMVDFPGKVRAKLEVLNTLQDQFLAADKYVIASPLWNHSVPAILRAYIDLVCSIGKTFKYTENGPVGLLTNRKALHIQSSGDVYSKPESIQGEFGLNYTHQLFAFIGVRDFTPVWVEGMDAFPHKAREIKQNAILEVERIAQTF